MAAQQQLAGRALGPPWVASIKPAAPRDQPQCAQHHQRAYPGCVSGADAIHDQASAPSAAGSGLACLSDFMTGADRASGQLVQVLAEHTLPARLRCFVDFLLEQLAAGGTVP